MSTDKTSKKEFVFEMTEEDRRQGLASGLTDDEMLPIGKHKFRRSRHTSKNAGAKLRVTMYLDADILEFFKNRASAPDAAPYQSQINRALRAVVESNLPESKSLKNELLEDEEFLRRLKERLAA